VSNKVIELLALGFRSSLTLVSPELNTKVVYSAKFHKKLDLNNPQTIDEKVLFLKLKEYASNPLIKQCADKYAVRDYVKEAGCEGNLNELIAVYENVDDIEWDKLPEKFALKWNFGCGHNIICEDKSKLDIENTKSKLKKWQRSRQYLYYSEMQYKGVPKKIIVEKYLESQQGSMLDDYKVYCFNGRPLYIMVCVGRALGRPKYYFFDKEWTLCRISNDGKNAPAGFSIPKPEALEELLYVAEQLSRPFKFVRSDFYVVDGKVIFGELTFTPSGAMDTEMLPETQLLFGSLLELE